MPIARQVAFPPRLGRQEDRCLELSAQSIRQPDSIVYLLSSKTGLGRENSVRSKCMPCKHEDLYSIPKMCFWFCFKGEYERSGM